MGLNPSGPDDQGAETLLCLLPFCVAQSPSVYLNCWWHALYYIEGSARALLFSAAGALYFTPTDFYC